MCVYLTIILILSDYTYWICNNIALHKYTLGSTSVTIIKTLNNKRKNNRIGHYI